VQHLDDVVSGDRGIGQVRYGMVRHHPISSWSGQTTVADSWLLPGQPQYKDIEERAVTRYPFDPSKADELIRGLGYTKGADGTYADASGKQLVIELRTTGGDDLREKMLLATMDYWKKIGLTGNPVFVPRQQAQDMAYRATFPGLELNRNPPDERGLPNLQFRTIPLAENDFRVTGNRSRYRNAELDGLVDKYFITIPADERMQIMGQIVKHVSDNLPILGVLYDAAPTLINRFATGRLTVVIAWSFVPLLVPMVFWNNPAVVMLSLSTGVFLNPAGNAGIGPQVRRLKWRSTSRR